MLEAFGCYRRRDAAIRRVFPQYGPGYRSKIVLPSVVDSDRYRIYSIVIQAPDGTKEIARLTTDAYLEIVATFGAATAAATTGTDQATPLISVRR